MIQAPEQRVVHLEDIIARAKAALDDGRYGDLRKILTTGKESTLKAVSTVLTKGM